MKKTKVILAIATSFIFFDHSYGQIISRPTANDDGKGWPTIKLSDWPKSLSLSYEYAKMLDGDDGRQMALLAQIANVLYRTGNVEQCIAVISSLTGVLKGTTAAEIATQLWVENSSNSVLAQKLFDFAVETAKSLAPAQQQNLYAKLAIVSAASPRQDHQEWLNLIYDEEVRQTAVGGCYIRTLSRAATVNLPDLQVWLNVSEQFKSPITKLYQAEGLLSVADALHSQIPPSRMKSEDFVFLCKKALEIVQQSGVPDVETVLRATEIMLAHKASNEAEVYFKRAIKKVMSLPLSFDKRPTMLMRLSSVARAMGNAEQASEFQTAAIIGSGQVESAVRGIVSLDVSKLLVKEGNHEKAIQLISVAAQRMAGNENANLRLEFLSRLYLDLFETKLVLPSEVVNLLSNLKGRN